MWSPTSQSSPSRASAYARWSVALPWRSDLTSLPMRARPASTRSSRLYSCRARRFSAISFSRWVCATRPIVGVACFLHFRCVSVPMRACFVARLIPGGGWKHPHPGWGRARARVNLVTGAAGQRDLDLALVAADLFHAHLDPVAEPVRPPASPPGQRRAELVQFEVVAGQPPRRQEGLEHLPEADEQARRDQPDDLTLERRFPAKLEQATLEQPREADLVGEVFELCGRPLAQGRMLRELRQILRERLVRDAELAQERAVADEIRLAADRRGEVAVRGARETRVAEVPRVIPRLLERLQDERREGVSPPPRPGDVIRDPLARNACDRGRIHRPKPLRNRRRRHAEVGELPDQQLDRLRLGPLVHPVERLAAAPAQQPCHGFVRKNHQLLDQHVRVWLGLAPGIGNAAFAVEPECGFRALDPQRATREPPVAQLSRHPVRPPQSLLERLLRT